MLEQRFWLVSLTGAVLILGLIYYLHAEREEAPVLTPGDVNVLVEQAVAPLEQLIADQSAELERLAAAQQEMVATIEDRALKTELEEVIARNTAVTRDSLKSDLRKYETRLDELQAQADDPAVANEIAATRAQITRIETALDDLSNRMDCADLAARTEVRTLVVPSRSSLEVPDETIVISVGRYRQGVLDAVSINARAELDEPISTRVVGEVPIGGSVEFRHEDRNYVATFINAASRFLSSALISIELRSAPVELADCR